MALGERNGYVGNNIDVFGDGSDDITSMGEFQNTNYRRKTTKRRRKTPHTKTSRRHRKVSRRTKKAKSRNGQTSRKSKRKYPHWLKKYWFKKKK